MNTLFILFLCMFTLIIIDTREERGESLSRHILPRILKEFLYALKLKDFYVFLLIVMIVNPLKLLGVWIILQTVVMVYVASLLHLDNYLGFIISNKSFDYASSLMVALFSHLQSSYIQYHVVGRGGCHINSCTIWEFFLGICITCYLKQF